MDLTNPLLPHLLFGITHPNCDFMSITLCILLLFFDNGPSSNYQEYHSGVMQAEKKLAESAYREALDAYKNVFADYSFLFVRDLKIAAQVAWYVRDTSLAIDYMERGISAGWSRKDIRGNNFLDSLRQTKAYRELDKQYQQLHSQFEADIDQTLREQVHHLFKQDQWRALGALFRIGGKAKDRYAERRFAPQSEEHLKSITTILENHGYPGEQLIRNDFWASTILSHHNSISKEYVLRDTLYHHIRPLLQNAYQRGEISPLELATIDDWYLTVRDGHHKAHYGILNRPSPTEIHYLNGRRSNAGLRSMELRNALIDQEAKTGMNLYTQEGWIQGK